jgi:hypothetical protein
MKKWIYFTLLSFHFLLLNSFTNYGAIFTVIEPSSTNRALGMTTGSVNIWHNSPLMNYANPAIGSFHEGFSFNFTNDPWFDKIPGLDDIYYDASLLSFGYKGISLTLPFYNGSNTNEKFGITMDYGQQDHTDEDGNLIGYFNSHETAQVYGLGLNMTEIYRNFFKNDVSLLNHFDVAVGANFTSIVSDIAPISINSDQISSHVGKTTKLDLGTIFKASYCFDEVLNLEAVYGLSHINAGKSEIRYTNESQSDIVYRHRNQGFAASISILSKNDFSGNIPDNYLFFENVISIRYLHSVNDDFNSEPNIIGYGGEFGFFDTFFIRKGYYSDKPGAIYGKTFGYGINLHFKKIVAFTYNYAEFPGGMLQKKLKSSDFAFNADFIAIFNLAKK